MRPADALDGNYVPVLFLHGAEDRFVTPRNARELYERTKGKKELYLIPGAEHAVSVFAAPEEYKEHVTTFLRELRV